MTYSKVFSQENNPVREIQFGTGYSHMRFLDKQVSPLLYYNHNAIVGFSFQKRKENRIFSAEITVCPGAIRSKEFKQRSFKYEYADIDGELNSFDMIEGNTFKFQNSIDINYLIKVNKLSNDRLNIYAGGMFKQYFYISMPFAPVFIMSELSLAPKIYLDYRLNQSVRLYSKLSSPLISVITRLPYSLDPADGKHNNFVATYYRGSDLTGLNSYQRVDFMLAAQKQINSKWAVSVEYTFNWFHYSERTGIKAYDNSIRFGLTRYLKTK
jgi:hypothetical protein